jgi:hypothetical protein
MNQTCAHSRWTCCAWSHKYSSPPRLMLIPRAWYLRVANQDCSTQNDRSTSIPQCETFSHLRLIDCLHKCWQSRIDAINYVVAFSILVVIDLIVRTNHAKKNPLGYMLVHRRKNWRIAWHAFHPLPWLGFRSPKLRTSTFVSSILHLIHL